MIKPANESEVPSTPNPKQEYTMKYTIRKYYETYDTISHTRRTVYQVVGVSLNGKRHFILEIKRFENIKHF